MELRNDPKQSYPPIFLAFLGVCHSKTCVIYPMDQSIFSGKDELVMEMLTQPKL